jgi:YVTN family beta-propeller protein
MDCVTEGRSLIAEGIPMTHSSPRTHFALIAFLLALMLPVRHAAAQGTVKAIFDLPASRFAVDPARPRIYASLTSQGAVAVIDTSTLTVTALIPIGSQPIGLSISPDGNTLYVANSGSITAGVGAIDLNTLTVLPSLPVPQAPFEIEAGVNNQLYMTPAGYWLPASLMQVSSTGTSASLFSGGLTVYSADLLQISPDRKTLYLGISSDPNSTLASFDVSGTSPQLLQQNAGAADDGQDLELSHSGSIIIYACSGIYSIDETPPSNLLTTIGTFSSSAYPHNFAFSPDDSIGYSSIETPEMLIYNTATCELTGSFAIAYGEDVNRIAVDSSGGSLFAATVTTDLDTPVNGLCVYDTGRPAASITSTNAIAVQAGAPVSYQVTASNGPTSYGATNLPPGLSVDPVGGTITGACSTPGYYQAFVSASNSIGVAIGDLNITVGTPPAATLNVIITGSGTVAMVSGTTQTSLSGSSSQVAGSLITLSASAATDSYFNGWTGDVTSTANSLNVPFNSEMSIQANFGPLPVGTLAGTVPVPAVRLAIDPVRPRMYATLTTGSLAVIDTNTLQIVTTLPIGVQPAGLAVSPDGSTLYAADSSSTSAGVDVVDLATLTVQPSLATPVAPSDVAVGPNNTLYLTPAASMQSGDLMQISTTGTTQLLFNDGNDDLSIGGGGFLQISRDQKTLYFGNTGVNPSTLASFDVSSGTPVLLQKNASTVGTGGRDLELSGSSVFYVNFSGQGGWDGGYGIYDIPDGNFSVFNLSYDQGAYPANIALSPDGVVAYSLPATQHELLIYDARTSGLIKSTTVVGSATRLKSDNSGRYLFAAATDDEGNPTEIDIYTTGRPGPVITSATSASVEAGYPFNYLTTATNNPTSFSATGLPSGLSMNPSTGAISGTAITSGTFEAYLSASNAYGTGMAGLCVAVSPGAAPVVSSGTEAGLYFGNSFNYQIAASGTGSLIYGGSGLPPGLSVNPVTGLISGTLGGAGDFTAIVSATDQITGFYGNGTLSLQIFAKLTVLTGIGGFVDPSGITFAPLGTQQTLSAYPFTGYLFQAWTGPSIVSSNPLPIDMPVSVEWTANFAPATFYAGAYSGLFSSAQPAADSSGVLVIRLLNTGIFTGYIEIGGVRYSILSAFIRDNQSTLNIPRIGLPPIALDLGLDLSGTIPVITGTASDGTWTTALSTGLTRIYTQSAPCPLAGNYTLALSSTAGPTGSGYARLSVSRTGLGTMTGVLADGTPFNVSAPIQIGGSMNVYTPLYAAKGSLAGNVVFLSASSTGELAGSLNWRKPAGGPSTAYPPAISTTLQVAGSSYSRVTGLTGTGGVMDFSGGRISGTDSYPFSLTPPLAIKIPAPGSRSASFALSPLNGIFSGSVIDGTRRAEYHGVILQQQNSGAGYFTDSAHGGAVSLSFTP